MVYLEALNEKGRLVLQTGASSLCFEGHMVTAANTHVALVCKVTEGFVTHFPCYVKHPVDDLTQCCVYHVTPVNAVR